VLPGLTGIAQIYAPRDIPRRHKFKYDLLYVRRQSIWLDVRLILLSFWITARGRGRCAVRNSDRALQRLFSLGRFSRGGERQEVLKPALTLEL
jgi:hypothetical protein